MSDRLGARVVSLTVLGLVVLAGIAYVALNLYAGDAAPRNARIEGVSVAGLDRAEAVDAVEEALSERAKTTIPVTFGDGRDAEIDPEAAGLSVDVTGSVADAIGGPRYSPQRTWAVLTGGGNKGAEVDVDDAKMQATLDRLDKALGTRPVEGTVAFRDGQAVGVRVPAGRRGQPRRHPVAARATVPAPGHAEGADPGRGAERHRRDGGAGARGVRQARHVRPGDDRLRRTAGAGAAPAVRRRPLDDRAGRQARPAGRRRGHAQGAPAGDAHRRQGAGGRAVRRTQGQAQADPRARRVRRRPGRPGGRVRGGRHPHRRGAQARGRRARPPSRRSPRPTRPSSASSAGSARGRPTSPTRSTATSTCPAPPS